MYERRLLQAGHVAVTPRFMMDDRGIHAMIGQTTMCGTTIKDFDPEYGPLQEVGTTLVTCPACLSIIQSEAA